MSDDVLDQIAANAQMAIDRLGEVADVPFGLDRASVAWVAGFIDRQRARDGFDPDDTSGLVDVLGSHLGEAIVAATGGRWEEVDDGWGWGVRLGSHGVCFPFTKVAKQLRDGSEAGESILSFYDVVLAMAAGRFDRS